MADGPEWFAQKRYGYGAGFPIAWQGWALLAVYAAILFATVTLAEEKPAVIAAIVVPVTAILLLITARTTRGGWRWRWGGRD